MNKIINFLKKYYPWIILVLIISIIFRQFILKGLLPIPSDIITGVYFPWLNQKWGTITGVPVKNPLPSDIPSLLYPWRLQVRNQIYSGNFPLWNDQIFSGMPLFANFQSSVLSISNLVFLFIKDNAMSWSLSVFVQPILMSFSAYIFLRKIRFSKVSALFGSLVFSLGGFSIVWLEYNVHGWVLFWLPLLLLSTEIIFEDDRWGNILLAIAVVGSILTGYPQLTLYSFLIVFVYVLIKFLLKQIKPVQIFKIVIFSSLGVLLSSCLLLPGLESARLSIRNVDTVATSIQTRYLPYTYLTNLFAPDLHGNPATGNYTGQGFYDNFAIYIGITSLVLAVIGLLSKITTNSIKYFSFFLILIGILLSTPNFIGLRIGELNLFGIKSIASRAMVISVFGILIASAAGMESIIKKIKIQDLIVPLVLTLFLGIMYLLSHDPIYRHNLYLPLLVSLSVFIVFILGKYLKNLHTFVPFIIVLLLSFELIRFSDKYLSFTPRNYLFPETPVISYLKNYTDLNNTKFEFAEVIPENMWVPFGFHSAAGYDATAPLAYSRLLGMVGGKDLSHPQGRVGKIDQINKITDMIGVNYLFTLATKNGKPDAEGDIKKDIAPPKFTLAYTEGPVKVFHISGSSDTIGFYSHAISYQNDLDFVSLANSQSFDPVTQVLVKNGETMNLEGPGSAKIKSYSPGKVVVTVNSRSKGYVVFKQNHYPGWQATIDGGKTTVLDADYSFMAVKVESGQHEVVFKYLPNSFIYGVGLSLISLLVLVGLIFKYVPK